MRYNKNTIFQVIISVVVILVVSGVVIWRVLQNKKYSESMPTVPGKLAERRGEDKLDVLKGLGASRVSREERQKILDRLVSGK